MAYLNPKPYVQNIRDCQTQPLISLGRNQTTSKLLCQAQGQGTGERSYYKRALYGPKGAEPPAFPTHTPLSLRLETVEETEPTLRTPKNVNKHFFKEERGGGGKFLGSCVGVVFFFNTDPFSRPVWQLPCSATRTQRAGRGWQGVRNLGTEAEICSRGWCWFLASPLKKVLGERCTLWACPFPWWTFKCSSQVSQCRPAACPWAHMSLIQSLTFPHKDNHGVITCLWHSPSSHSYLLSGLPAGEERTRHQLGDYTSPFNTRLLVCRVFASLLRDLIICQLLD